MTEHLRYLSQHARVPLSVMPNAGLPQLTADGAVLPADAGRAGRGAASGSSTSTARALVGGCCGTTPEHIAPGGRRALRRRGRRRRATPSVEPGVVLDLPPRAVRAGRQRADGRGADQRQRLQGVPRRDARRRLPDAASRSPASQARDGSHLLDLCVDYVGPRRRRRHARAGRPVRHRLHAADHARLDRAERDRGRPGDARRPLRRQLGQLRGRRRPRLPLRAGDADRRGARRGRGRADHRRGGPGPYGGVEGAGRRAG